MTVFRFFRYILVVGLLMAGVVIGYLYFSSATILSINSGVPVPDIKNNKPVHIRVAYYENKRFPTVPLETISRVLGKAAIVTKEKLGVSIVVDKIDRLSLDDISQRLKSLPDGVAKHELARSYSHSRHSLPNTLHPEFVEYMAECIKNYAVPLDDYAAYVGYVGNKVTADRVADYLSSKAIERYNLIASSIAPDGHPLVDGSWTNEFKFWQVLGYSDNPYEIVITNQPIISLEWDACSPHAMLRGGTSVGGTTYSKYSQYGTYAVYSLYTFLSENLVLNILDRGPVYTEGELIEYAGAYLAHEYGHMLLHLGHPLTRDECIMKPSANLDIRKWWSVKKDEECPVGSSKTMVPGFVKFNRIDYEQLRLLQSDAGGE